MSRKGLNMNTEEKLGIKKPKAIMLFIQMFFITLLLIASIYLLVFVISNNLGGWMITSYVFITLSVLALISYAIIGFKKVDNAYQLAVLPFLIAIFVNVLLPNRETFQVALLTILFALTFAFLLRQKDKKFTFVILILMMLVSLTFSVYSAIKANTQFLGDVSKNWPTYVAMYASIFVPVIMSGTFALTYNVRVTK